MSAVAIPGPDEGDDFDFVAPDPVLPEDEDATEVMWMERNATPFTPTPEHPFRAVRCTGITRNGPRTGRRCGRKATLGTTVCEKHGAQLPAVKKAAENRRLEIQLRLVGMTSDAVDGIADILANGVSEAVRLKAATEILDRAGIRGGSELNVTVEQVDTAADAVREKLEMLRRRVIEGELADENALNGANSTVEHVTVDPVDMHNPAEE